MDKPVIFSSHGYFTDYAMKHSGWKKKIAWSLFQRKDLNHAMCIHANTVGEVDMIRKRSKKPIVIIPNGVEPSCFDNTATFGYHPAIPKDKKVLLFLGRLHRIKGIANLLCAWNRISKKYKDWQLVIAGPDAGMLDLLKEQAKVSTNSITLTGPVFWLGESSAL